jgi:hypothetical protein
VGLGIDDAIWSSTTFTKNRDRLLAGDIASAFCDAVLIHADTARLLSHEHFTVHGTAGHVETGFSPRAGRGQTGRWARDEGRCAFVGDAGRCTERGFLEFHHVVPFAEGGATDAANLQLRCRAHNAFEAEEWFGPLIARERPPAYTITGTRSGPS